MWSARTGTMVCGIVRSYLAPTATTAGALEIGSRRYTLAVGERMGAAFPVTAGAAQCVWGGIDAPIGPLGASTQRFDLGLCGRVRAFAPSTTAAPGRIEILEYWSLARLSLPIAAGVDLGAPAFDSYRCMTVHADPVTGDATVQGLSEALADVALACGVVKAFAPPTTSAAGSITVGSHVITLPAGTPYQRDPAGARTDPTAVGQVLCFNALLDDAGTVRRYGPHFSLAQPDGAGNVGAGMCGREAGFRAPTAGAAGYIAISIKFPPFVIPATATITTAPPCVTLHVDQNGDLVVPAPATPDPGRVVGF